ncbi:hypothetical protein GQ55_6G048800 [Panicum hallii var. hallii]|uniref:Uncharacterized protein n=1 Tax=Panicum hallii var. hallii TaxID=1504633 RepID=A0A2T7D410_9POAL|nr:hypothetical protein GQ55_6G048800 [Panicum hallii var. hallii]
MASPSSAPASPLPRHQLLRSVPSGLGVALNRPPAPPTISLARVPRAVDAAGASQLRAARRGASSPKGGPGSPAQGGGGKVHAAPLAATARVVMRRGPTPPGRPAEGGGGKVHAAPAASTARFVTRGPARPSSPAEGAGGRGGVVHAADS